MEREGYWNLMQTQQKTFVAKTKKIELQERFDDCRKLQELTTELLEERDGNSVLFKEKEVISLMKDFNSSPCILNDTRS